MAQPTIKPIIPVPTDQAWLSLEYDLSIQEMRKFGHVLGRVYAIEWIRANQEDPEGPVDHKYVERLAFTRWRYVTHRLSEFVGAGL